MQEAMESLLRPTFFELYAAEQLSGALQPALRFTLEVLSVRHPALMRLAERADEVFAAMSLAFELTSLRRDGATLAEAFYSLRRAPAFEGAASRASLRPRAVLTGLLWSVLAPYLRRKLEDLYISERARARSSVPYPPHRQVSFRALNAAHSRVEHVRATLLTYAARTNFVARRVLVAYFPAFTATADGSQLLCKLLYLLNFTRYFSPALATQALVLRRLSVGEMHGLAAPSSVDAPRATLQQVMRVGDTVITGVKYAFFAALVAFRFLEYYHAAEVRSFLARYQSAVRDRTHSLTATLAGRGAVRGRSAPTTAGAARARTGIHDQAAAARRRVPTVCATACKSCSTGKFRRSAPRCRDLRLTCPCFRLFLATFSATRALSSTSWKA
eukprot:IDg1931t1